MVDTKEIRKQLKAELGYNAKQVSVKNRDYLELVFTIRDADVEISKVKEFASQFEHIRRDYASGEILSGGNTFVDVKLSDEVRAQLEEKYLPIVEPAFAEAKLNPHFVQKIGDTGVEVSYDDVRNDYTLWSETNDRRFPVVDNAKIACRVIAETL